MLLLLSISFRDKQILNTAQPSAFHNCSFNSDDSPAYAKLTSKNCFKVASNHFKVTRTFRKRCASLLCLPCMMTWLFDFSSVISISLMPRFKIVPAIVWDRSFFPTIVNLDKQLCVALTYYRSAISDRAIFQGPKCRISNAFALNFQPLKVWELCFFIPALLRFWKLELHIPNQRNSEVFACIFRVWGRTHT